MIGGCGGDCGRERAQGHEQPSARPAIDKTYLGYFGTKHTFKPTAIVIHHTCTATPRDTRKRLEKKGYSTHFEVDQNGHIYQYMETRYKAAHVGSANCHCIGIDCTHLAGKPFPTAQVDAVRALVAWLCYDLGIPHEVHNELAGIYPHSAIGCTACPNGFPMEDL